MAMCSRRLLASNRLSSLWIVSLVLFLPDHKSAGRSDQAFASPSHPHTMAVPCTGHAALHMFLRERGCLRIRGGYGGYLSRLGEAIGLGKQSPQLVVPDRLDENMAAPPLSLDLTRRDSPNRRARTATSAAAQTLAETGTGKGNATGGMRILEEIKGGLRGSKKNGTGSPSAPKSRRSSRRCKQMGCSKRAHYGNDADKASVFCAGHRLAVRPSQSVDCGRAAPIGCAIDRVVWHSAGGARCGSDGLGRERSTP